MRGKSQRIPPLKALYYLATSVLLVTGSAALILFIFLQWQHQKKRDPRLFLTTMIQTGPQKNALPSEYLAELMGMSRDQPPHLLSFNVKKKEAALLLSPLIKTAKVTLITPQTVYVDYSVRKPLAWLYEYENTALDEEGYIFPVRPFFSPKQLPELYLGLPPFGNTANPQELSGGRWNLPLQGKEVKLGLKLLQLTCHLPLRRIDLSNAYSPSLGSREIVLYLEDEFLHRTEEKEHLVIVPRLIRLSTKNFSKELSNFLELRKELLEKEKQGLNLSLDTPFIYTACLQVIDLRIDGLGFMKTVSNKQDSLGQ